MRIRRIISILIALALLVLIALAVVVWRYSHIDSAETAEDCGWDARAVVWLDKNGNGIWDEGEQPFQGVKIFVDDTLNHYTKVGRDSVSDFRGAASLSVWLPGCPNVEFEIYAEPPTGYRLTTPPRVPAKGKTAFEFGLLKGE